jgi:hypothetical protein
VGLVASGADDVGGLGGDRHAHRLGQDGRREARHLLGSFALGAHCNQESGELHRVDVTGYDLAQILVGGGYSHTWW